MEDSFFFALLRISVAQMLKASGFDKCKPSVLDMVTDLYIRHLELLTHKAQTFAVARTSSVNELEPQDVVEALLNTGFLKPSSPQDPLNKKNTKSLDSLVNWVKYSDGHAVSRRLNAVPPSVLANLIEKRKIDTSSETDQERKKRRLRERQEYFNQLKQGDDSAKPEKHADLDDDFDDDELTPNDKLSWLAYLAEKDMKLGQNMKFVNTCIQDDLVHVHKLKKFHPTPADGEDSYVQFKHHMHNFNRNDHVLIQVQEDDKTDSKLSEAVLPSPALKSILPYNVKYDETLTDDDLQQYMEYASAHEDEIRERLHLLEQGGEQGNEKSIEETTEKSTHEGIEKSAEENTEKSAVEIPEKSVQETSEKDTEENTEKSTEENTEKSTEENTEKSTEENTEKSTEEIEKGLTEPGEKSGESKNETDSIDKADTVVVENEGGQGATNDKKETAESLKEDSSTNRNESKESISAGKEEDNVPSGVSGEQNAGDHVDHETVEQKAITNSDGTSNTADDTEKIPDNKNKVDTENSGNGPLSDSHTSSDAVVSECNPSHENSTTDIVPDELSEGKTEVEASKE